MKTLAVTVRLATLALTAALGSTAFAQTAGHGDAGMTLALNNTPPVREWQPTVAVSEEPARAVARELAISVEEMTDKLNRQLEAKIARKLELAI